MPGCHRFLHTAATRNRIIHPSLAFPPNRLCPSAEFIMNLCSPLLRPLSHSLTHLVHFGNSPPKPRTLCFSAASVVRRPPTAASLTRGDQRERSGVLLGAKRTEIATPPSVPPSGRSLARPGERTRSPRLCGQKPARATSPPVSLTRRAVGRFPPDPDSCLGEMGTILKIRTRERYLQHFNWYFTVVM